MPDRRLEIATLISQLSAHDALTSSLKDLLTAAAAQQSAGNTSVVIASLQAATKRLSKVHTEPSIELGSPASLGDIDDEFDPDIDLPDLVAPVQPPAAVAAGLDDEVTTAPIDLTASTPATEDIAAVIRALNEDLIPTLADIAGAYIVGLPVSDGVTLSIPLTAVGDSDTWLAQLPAATVVFDNLLGRTNPFPIVVRIAGEIDPENPPLDQQTCLEETLATLAADPDFDASIPDGIFLSIQRLDNQALTPLSAQAPLDTALRSIEAKLGSCAIEEILPGETQSEVIARLNINPTGQLDMRALSLGLAGFTGTLDFPGLGQVKASITSTY